MTHWKHDYLYLAPVAGDARELAERTTELEAMVEILAEIEPAGYALADTAEVLTALRVAEAASERVALVWEVIEEKYPEIERDQIIAAYEAQRDAEEVGE